MLWCTVVNAIAAAEVRFSTFSFMRICSTCFEIVPVHAPRIRPISSLVLPCAIQQSTSASRGVSPRELSDFPSLWSPKTPDEYESISSRFTQGVRFLARHFYSSSAQSNTNFADCATSDINSPHLLLLTSVSQFWRKQPVGYQEFSQVFIRSNAYCLNLNGWRRIAAPTWNSEENRMEIQNEKNAKSTSI